MKATQSGSRKPHVEIANWLFARLALVLGGATVASRTVTIGSGSAGFVFALVLYLVTLWLAVHLVFSALNDLLEAKFEAKLDAVS